MIRGKIMKKTTKKLLALLAIATLTVGTLTACGTEAEDTATETETTTETTTEETTETEAVTEETVTETAQLEGTILMAGSTSMEKLASVVAEAFMEMYPGVTVNAEFTGSSAGIESVLAGSVDIGNSSRGLKDSEKEAGAIENIVAIDGIAVIVDPANTVADLTKEQLVGIYTGTIKNWSEVGGTDAPIIVVGREAGSGTRGAFEELVEVEDICVYSNELDSTGAVMAKVASTPGAIGYVSLDVIDDTVVAVALDGVAANEENIKAGTYFLSRPFVMATVGEISEQNEAVQAMFEFLASEDGKSLIKSVGLITVD
jgi:phosphate transport system substrate-binding protein